MKRASTLLVIGVTLIGAIIIEYLAPWPFIMTPLFAIPVLVAAQRLSPRGVAATATLVTVVNFGSGLLEGTPLAVVLLYTAGLLLTTYLAVALAWQCQVSARHAQAAERQARAAELAQKRLQLFLGMVTHDL